MKERHKTKSVYEMQNIMARDYKQTKAHDRLFF